jgi:hypothetical protein
LAEIVGHAAAHTDADHGKHYRESEVGKPR